MAKKEVIKVGLLGLGTVGYGVFKTLKLQKEAMVAKIGSRIEIKRILVLKIADFADKVEDPSILTENADDILDDPEIDVVIEVIGGTRAAFDFQKKALENGKHVISANKDLVATRGHELLLLAGEKKLDYFFEAAVAGGIPIIRPLRHCLLGNNISEILGIVNGTTNYILTKMSRDGANYDEVLKMAQDLGYAEADPTSDVEGLDAARKVAIMASIAFHSQVTFDDVYKEGITKITSKDIDLARELGWVIKLIGITREKDGAIEACVYPMLIPKDHPMASVHDSFNAVFVHGDAVDDVMFYGRGAGEMPTASAIVGDLFDVVRNINDDCTGRSQCTCYRSLPIRPVEEIENKFFVRMQVCDNPGVLEAITSVFHANSVNIESILQKSESLKDQEAEIVLTTGKVVEKNFRKALEELEAMDIILAISSVIRVY